LCRIPSRAPESVHAPEYTPLIIRPQRPSALQRAIRSADNRQAAFYGVASLAWVLQSVCVELVVGTTLALFVVLTQGVLLMAVLLWRARLRAMSRNEQK
jgi:Flp pilus assembly protein TadB